MLDVVVGLLLVDGQLLDLEEQAQFEAIRDWKPGDAWQTDYATDQGRYFQYKPDCSGMRCSKTVAIEEALAAGKPACSICIDGINSRLNTVYDFRFSDNIYFLANLSHLHRV